MTDEITEDYIRDMVEDYDKDNLTIATVCSHTSLQIFNGAKKEGLRTIVICLGEPPKFYDAFPLAKPDSFMSVSSYMEILERTDELARKNAIIIPHGSFVEYMGASNFATIKLPTFGNRKGLVFFGGQLRDRVY